MNKVPQPNLKIILQSFSQMVSSLDVSCKRLLKGLLEVEWLSASDISACYIQLMENLVSAHSTHALVVCEMVIGYLNSGKSSTPVSKGFRTAYHSIKTLSKC